jgi:hypothetical protein
MAAVFHGLVDAGLIWREASAEHVDVARNVAIGGRPDARERRATA